MLVIRGAYIRGAYIRVAYIWDFTVSFFIVIQLKLKVLFHYFNQVNHLVPGAYLLMSYTCLKVTFLSH